MAACRSMQWHHTSRVKPTSSRYLSDVQPIGGPNGIGRYRAGGGVRHRPLTAFGPTARSCATISSFVSWARSRVCRSVLPPTHMGETLSLFLGATLRHVVQ